MARPGDRVAFAAAPDVGAAVTRARELDQGLRVVRVARSACGPGPGCPARPPRRPLDLRRCGRGDRGLGVPLARPQPGARDHGLAHRHHDRDGRHRRPRRRRPAPSPRSRPDDQDERGATAGAARPSPRTASRVIRPPPRRVDAARQRDHHERRAPGPACPSSHQVRGGSSTWTRDRSGPADDGEALGPARQVDSAAGRAARRRRSACACHRRRRARPARACGRWSPTGSSACAAAGSPGTAEATMVRTSAAISWIRPVGISTRHSEESPGLAIRSRPGAESRATSRSGVDGGHRQDELHGVRVASSSTGAPPRPEARSETTRARATRGRRRRRRLDVTPLGVAVAQQRCRRAGRRRAGAPACGSAPEAPTAPGRRPARGWRCRGRSGRPHPGSAR